MGQSLGDPGDGRVHRSPIIVFGAESGRRLRVFVPVCARY
jgi:hypothetical protein